jgi:hypothetical protein
MALMEEHEIQMNSPPGIAQIANGACGVTIKKSEEYIKTFAVLGGYMNTSFVMFVRCRERCTEITDKMDSKLIQ